MAAPIRTCIGCRQRDAAAEMVRLLVDEGADGGQVVVAGSGRTGATGRGASLHARPACLETGLRPEVLSRAFKRRVTIHDAADLLERITIVSRRKR
jgi:predicted RNA-binding protein YlxR (DUF448 family)